MKIDAKRCPHLAAALERGTGRLRQGWVRVYEARQAGHIERASRIAARLLGVQGETMSDEKKEELRAYYEAHKEEIAAKRRAKVAAARRMRMVLRSGRRV